MDVCPGKYGIRFEWGPFTIEVFDAWVVFSNKTIICIAVDEYNHPIGYHPIIKISKEKFMTFDKKPIFEIVKSFLVKYRLGIVDAVVWL
jgi:hypothetical protein